MNYLEQYRLYSVKSIAVKTLGLPEGLLVLWERLHAANAGLFLVGGSVRDYLLGLTSTDFDFCTPQSYEQLKPLVASLGWELTVINESMQVMLLKLDSSTYEIARLRVDGDYADGRRPMDVVFTEDLRLDYLRRDYKINALYLTFEGDVLDFCGGMSDINHRALTTVRDTKTTLEEDGLRLLRGIRFASTLGFALTAEFMHCATGLAHMLMHVSSERRLTELRGILESPHWHRGLELLEGCNLLQVAFRLDPISYQLNMTLDALDFSIRFAQCLAQQTLADETHILELVGRYPLMRTEKREIEQLIRAYVQRLRPVDLLYHYEGDLNRLKLFLHGFKDAVTAECIQYIIGSSEEGLPLSREALLIKPQALLAMGWDGKDLRTLCYTLFLKVHAGLLPNSASALEPAAKNILLGERLHKKL